MKRSQEWHLFADLLEERATRIRVEYPDSNGIKQVSISLIGASADATRVAQVLEKEGL